MSEGKNIFLIPFFNINSTHVQHNMATFVADNKEDADRVQQLFNEVRLQNENQPFLS